MASRGDLILATGSRYKRELFDRLGLRYRALEAGIVERRIAGEPPARAAARLARDKARAVAQAEPEAWIIGGDQVVALEGEPLHKPGSAERAVAQLTLLSGRSHQLYCAVALRTPAGAWHEACVEVELEMRALSQGAIARYVAMDEPLDCAGSYRLEAAGIRLFRAMRCDDYTAIIGLPLTRIVALLEHAGYLDDDYI